MHAKLIAGRILSVCLILGCVHTTSAGTPVWSFTPLTETTVAIPVTGTATVQYKITNQSSKTHVLSMQNTPGVTQITTGSGACGNPFTLTGNASCTLSLQVIGSELTSSLSNGPIVCEQGSTLQCYQPSPADSLHVTTLPVTRAYVGDGSNTLWQCPIASSGEFSEGCAALTNSTAPGFSRTIYGTPYEFSGTTYVYVADASQQLWQCQLDSTGAVVGGCTALTNVTSPGFAQTVKATFHTFSGTTYAYVASVTNILWQCPMNDAGGFSGGCTALTNNPTFGQTQTVTFQNFSGVTYAYLGDRSDTLWQCPMNAGGGFSGDCTALANSTPPHFQTIVNAEFYTFSGVRYAYVGDNSDTLWQCQMNATGGFVGGCTALTNASTPFVGTMSAAFNVSDGITSAYVGDRTTNIWRCIMTSTGGFDGGCTALDNTTSPGFLSTRGPVLY
ncbi:MAG: hypothetical protein P1U36_01225 [Legionellaceae bacterium]|nr:hypothetical protein [Legionellaceae bacterium]